MKQTKKKNAVKPEPKVVVNVEEVLEGKPYSLVIVRIPRADEASNPDDPENLTFRNHASHVGALLGEDWDAAVAEAKRLAGEAPGSEYLVEIRQTVRCVNVQGVPCP